MDRSVVALATAVEKDHPIVSRLYVQSGSCRVRVDTNCPKLKDLLADYFRQWVAPVFEPDVVVTALESDARPLDVGFADWQRDPGKTGRKDEFVDLPDGRVVRKVRTGMQYLLGGGHHLVFGEATKNYNQVVNFVDAQVINWLMRRGAVLCHAAGVARGERGVGISGISGAGKSTLSLHIVTRGLDFVSNDRLLIRRSGSSQVMDGVPKQPRVNPGTLMSIPELGSVLPPERRAALEKLGKDELWELEEKYDADIGRLFGEGRFRLTAPLVGYLVLLWNRKETTPTRFERVDLAEKSDALAAIMKAPGPFFEGAADARGPSGIRRAAPAEYIDAFKGLPVFEATGRVDFDAAVRFVTTELLPGSGSS
jgi:HprK-related kinase B